MLLHVASTPAGAAVTVSIIFLLIFAMSFAFGPVPEGGRRFTSEWTRAWFIASIPRMIVAGVFAGLVLAAALTYGGSSTQAAINCERNVPPLTGQAVTDDRLFVAVASLNEMIDAADGGDPQRAQTVWLTSDAHNLSHDVDGPLRRVSPDSAGSLCESVVALENVMVGQIVPSQVASNARSVADGLQAARLLLRDSGSQTPAIFEPCREPIGAISDQPLAAQRIRDAIEQMRRVGSMAAAGDQSGAEALFAGDAHDITHDIDGPLRIDHEQIAVDLCLAVTEIEVHLGADYDGGVVAMKATESADLLEDGGRALGILQ